jgi:hypothetical protein
MTPFLHPDEVPHDRQKAFGFDAQTRMRLPHRKYNSPCIERMCLVCGSRKWVLVSLVRYNAQKGNLTGLCKRCTSSHNVSVRLSPLDIPPEMRDLYDYESQSLEQAGHCKRMEIDRTCIDCGEVGRIAVTQVRKAAKSGTLSGLCLKCSRQKPPPKIGSLRGEQSPSWTGGRRIQKGYVVVYAPNHPNAQKRGYILEHRLVMSNLLGRALLPGETVHHRNGVCDDNRPENLELRGGPHGPGSRYDDWTDEQIATLIDHLRGILRSRQ